MPKTTNLRPRPRALQGADCAYSLASLSRARVPRQHSRRSSSASVHRRLLHLQREGTSRDWTRCYSEPTLSTLRDALSVVSQPASEPDLLVTPGGTCDGHFLIIDDVLRKCVVLLAKARAAAAVHAALGSWREPSYPRCRRTTCIPLRVSSDPGVRDARKARTGSPPREPGRHASARRGCDKIRPMPPGSGAEKVTSRARSNKCMKLASPT